MSLCLFHRVCFVLQARANLLISISTSVANLLSLLALLSLEVKKKTLVANKPDKACNTNNDNIAPRQWSRGRAYICYLIRCACDLMLDF